MVVDDPGGIVEYRNMSKTYTPGPETDDIVARQLATGQYASPDDVVRTGVLMLEERDSELTELRRSIDAGDADIAAGSVHRYESGNELAADIIARGEERSKARR